jgi:hypothetical protein
MVVAGLCIWLSYLYCHLICMCGVLMYMSCTEVLFIIQSAKVTCVTCIECIMFVVSCIKVKQSHYKSWQVLRALRFHDNRHMKMTRLSALRTGRLYTQETFLVLISVRGWVDPRAIVRPEGLCNEKFWHHRESGIVAQRLNHCTTSCPVVRCVLHHITCKSWCTWFNAVRCVLWIYCLYYVLLSVLGTIVCTMYLLLELCIYCLYLTPDYSLFRWRTAG